MISHNKPYQIYNILTKKSRCPQGIAGIRTLLNFGTQELIYQIRVETEESIMNMEGHYLEMTGKKDVDLSWRVFARKKILAAFGNEKCGNTVLRLNYVEHVTVDPDLKKIIHDLTSQIATMNVFHPEKYLDLLAEARKVDELWRIKANDLGYFTIKD